MTLPALLKLREAVLRRPEEIAAEKSNGKIIVGWVGYLIPEEIIHALGLIPVQLGRGGDERLVELGARYISSQNCAFIRACMGMFAENTDPYIQHCDAVAFDNACMQVYRLGEVSQYYCKKKTLFLGVPRDPTSNQAKIYFRHEVEHFTRNLESLAGRGVEPERLAESVALYQNIRNAICDLYHLLDTGESPLEWKEISEVVHAGYSLDKTKYLALVRELLDEIRSAPQKTHPEKTVRIILSGSRIAPGDKKLGDLIGQAKGTIVGDDLWSGLNPFLKVPIREPTIVGIADAYLDRLPHTTLPCLDKENDPRFEHLKATVQKTNAQGVIYHTIRYCDPATLKTAGLKNRLREEGIPLLEIHTEYSGSDVEAIRTRIEAFFEILNCRDDGGVRV